MKAINELEIRELLDGGSSPSELRSRMLKRLMDSSSASWDTARPLWHLLYNLGLERTVMESIKVGLESKQRIPFDLFIEITTRAKLEPSKAVIASLVKGLKKQKALEDLLCARGWDKWDDRLPRVRKELAGKHAKEQKAFKESLKEKFEFLKSQRMNQQAGRVLKRMLELYPDEQEFLQFKKEFDELWAREVLASHLANLNSEKLDRTLTAPSTANTIMLQCFLQAGEKLALEQREVAFDLALAFWFLDDFGRALEILGWAPINTSTDWLRAELLFAARRFVEALEHLNQLEIKYIELPETTFAVSYLRAQCLHALGQSTTALEIMQSIVRVRAQYRSAHALILEWTAGVSWE